MNSRVHTDGPDLRSRLMAARLPSMPQTLHKLMELCQQDDVGLNELTRLIAQDPAMTARMLTAANSPAYRRSGPSNSLEQALLTMGSETIKTIVTNDAVFQVFDKLSSSPAPDLRPFWVHSLSAAFAARLLAVRMKYSNPEEAYLAGLLHDIGRLALLALTPKSYARHFMADDDEDLCAVELRVLETTHAEAGCWLIRKWQLDSFIADSILYHHAPLPRLEQAHPLIRIARLSHMLNGDALTEPRLGIASALSGLPAEEVQDLQSQVQEQVRQAAAGLGIDLDAGHEQQEPRPDPASALDPARERLSAEVRNLVLATQLGKSFAGQRGESGLLETITQSASVLFHFDGVAVLQMSRDGGLLQGARVGEYRHRLADFSLSLVAGQSQLAAAVRQRRVVLVGEDFGTLGIADEQLLRLFGTGYLACLPLLADKQCLGVIVGGLHGWQLSDFDRRESYLAVFGVQSALALKQIQLRQEELEHATENMARSYREASRKVAHEVNNPLSIIKNYLSILDRKLLNKDQVGDELAILHEEIDRVGKIVDEFADHDFAEKKGSTGIQRAVQDVVRLFLQSGFASPAVHIETRLQDGELEVRASADLLKQVLINLIKNAVEAMPEGGSVEISSHGMVNREGVLYAELSVRDSGPGIPAEIMSNLFSAGSSTKGDGRGLGLNIVYDLIRKVQGLITCRSNRQGTAFEILLPLAPFSEPLPHL